MSLHEIVKEELEEEEAPKSEAIWCIRRFVSLLSEVV
jgi:hypothetical protein